MLQAILLDYKKTTCINEATKPQHTIYSTESPQHEPHATPIQQRHPPILGFPIAR